MKKLSLLSIALIFSLVATFAQSNETRTFNVSGSFDGINISGTQTVHFDIGPAGQPITAIGTQDDLDNMEIKITGSTLNVGFKKGYRTKSKSPVQVYVKNPTLKSGSVSGTGLLNISGKLGSGDNKFSVSGTGTVSVDDIDCKNLECIVSGTGTVKCPGVEADKVTATVSGTGKINLSKIEATTVKATVSGTGNINLQGACEKGLYTCTGTGNIQATELHAKEVNATANGTGNVFCYARQAFEGGSAGIGKVHLYGKPEKVKFSGDTKKLIEN